MYDNVVVAVVDDDDGHDDDDVDKEEGDDVEEDDEKDDNIAEDEVEDDDVAEDEVEVDDVENDDVEEEEDDGVEEDRDDVEEEDRSQDLDPHFVRACAVEMHLDISPESLAARIYRQDVVDQGGDHTMCKPAQSKCTWTLQETSVLGNWPLLSEQVALWIFFDVFKEMCPHCNSFCIWVLI